MLCSLIQLLYVGYFITEKLDLLAVWQFLQTKALLQTSQDKPGELFFLQMSSITRNIKLPVIFLFSVLLVLYDKASGASGALGDKKHFCKTINMWDCSWDSNHIRVRLAWMAASSNKKGVGATQVEQSLSKKCCVQNPAQEETHHRLVVDC